MLAVLDPQPDDDILQRLLDRADAAVSSGSDAPGEMVLRDFVRRYTAVPEWVDWSEIQRGQKVFVRNLPICGLTLCVILADTVHLICECLVPWSPS